MKTRLFSISGSLNPSTEQSLSSNASEFPDWAYQPRDFFRFEILHQSEKSQGRTEIVKVTAWNMKSY